MSQNKVGHGVGLPLHHVKYQLDDVVKEFEPEIPPEPISQKRKHLEQWNDINACKENRHLDVLPVILVLALRRQIGSQRCSQMNSVSSFLIVL